MFILFVILIGGLAVTCMVIADEWRPYSPFGLLAFIVAIILAAEVNGPVSVSPEAATRHQETMKSLKAWEAEIRNR